MVTLSTIKHGGRVPKRIHIVLPPVIVLLMVVIITPPAFAQSITPGETVDYTQLLPAALTLLLPVGMILLISSAMPEDKAPAAAINLLIVWSVAALSYFVVGFAFQFGGIAQVSRNPELSGLYWEWYPLDQSVDVNIARMWGVIALRGWLLSGEASTNGALLLFLNHVSLVGTAAMIPAGALIQRARWTAAIVTSLVMGTLIYPLAGNWLWGGGWLSNLGTSLGLGHGFVDFGGASVIFLAGSGVALIALILLRPAIPKEVEPDEVVSVVTDGGLTVYNDTSESTTKEASGQEIPFQESPAQEGAFQEGAFLEGWSFQATPMPSAYLPILSMLGAGLMLVGWFGLTTGVHAPTAVNFTPAHAAANGLLAALAGALTAAGYSLFTTREVNALMTARGLAAGLVVAIAGAPFGPIWLYVVAGLVMGLLVPLLIYLFDQKLPVSDDLGTLTTYGLSAIFGLLLVSFFADGQAGPDWNGVGPAEYLGVAGQGVSGLIVAPGFVPDWPGQFQAQLLGAGAILIWSTLLSFILFQTVNAVSDAWARTGLELTGPAAAKANPSQPDFSNTAEEQIDSYDMLPKPDKPEP